MYISLIRPSTNNKSLYLHPHKQIFCPEEEAHIEHGAPNQTLSHLCCKNENSKFFVCSSL